jgi:hypothetical protein
VRKWRPGEVKEHVPVDKINYERLEIQIPLLQSPEVFLQPQGVSPFGLKYILWYTCGFLKNNPCGNSRL